MKKRVFSKDEKEAIGQRIRQIRITSDATMSEFGELISPESPVAQSIISRWERGISVPNSERLNQISKFASVSMHYLIDGNPTFSDIHILPEDQIEKMKTEQNQFYLDTKAGFIKSAKKNMDKIDWNNIPSQEIYLIDHFFRFIDNFRGLNENEYILRATIILASLNELYDDFTDEKLSKKDKIKIINQHIADFNKSNINFFDDLSSFLKNQLD